MSLSDFNDLHVLQGLDAVRDAVLAAGFPAADPIAEPIEENFPRPSAERAPDFDKPPIDTYADELGAPQLGRYDFSTLLAKFWLVYGSDTVWDSLNRIQMRLSHLRHPIGRARYKEWDESPLRRIVRGIRFEPGADLGNEWVNLYNGFEMAPDARGVGGCQKIRDHLFRLCSYREDEFFWLLSWIAYPLQNPGAKMASSVIMYGSEGPGKSIIWEQVVKRIYGEYGVTIGQAQLDSQFTGWQSKRLFALAEEVVNRSERSHHKGALKHLVTGSTLMINEKNLPLREESNHVNFVFLSNSTTPLELDFGDRRYCVLYCADVPPAEYFADLFAEINAGGVECFFHYLMNLDLTGFGPHTKPPLNEEKRNLINSSLSPPLYFLHEWESGDLELPYGCAQVSDLWAAFQRWSEHSNEFKRRRREFEAELRRRCRHERTHISYPTASSYNTHRFWVPPGILDGVKDRTEYLRLAGDQCRAFAAAVNSARSQEGRGDV